MTKFEPNDAYLAQAFEMAMDLKTGVGITGYGTITLWDEFGEIKQCQPFSNKISDNGDFYYATRAGAAVAPTNLSDATKVTGMKLGTSSATAPGKGTGNVLGAYQTGSNKTFTSTALTNMGTGAGYQLGYLTNWTGSQTWSGLVEAIICDDASTDGSPTVTHVIARVTYSSVNKGTTDTFAIQWNHIFLGG